MEAFTLKDIMRVLEEGWGEYIGQFKSLSTEAQKAFLEKQGYESFHDLLAHIVGWWEEGLRVITGIIDEPGFTYEDRDIDAYNQELVEKYRPWSDDDLFLHFENVREAKLDLVSELNEDALTNRHIRGWLYANVIEHLEDHKIA